jgi:hypothetical protein
MAVVITESTLAEELALRAEESETFAPGWPGIPARWTSSAKSGIGTAVSRDSRVWFTLSHGILNEIYYPRVDHACTRDLGFIVTDGRTYFSEESEMHGRRPHRSRRAFRHIGFTTRPLTAAIGSRKRS